MALKTAFLAVFGILSAAVVFVCYAGPEPIVEIPTSAQMGIESKSVLSDKNTVAEEEEPAKWWSLNMQAGYWSEYLFRGTNLTPNTDGITYQQLYVSAKGFTLGAWVATQLNKAVVPGATSVGESGSGISPFNVPGVFEDVAVQHRFQEVDVFSSYSHSFGPLDVTVGNIAFFISRSEVDEFHFAPFGPNDFTPFAVPENEQFDRLFVALSTHSIHPFGISITPTVTYYQTVYNHADPIVTSPGEGGPQNASVSGVVNCTSATPCSDSQYELDVLGFKRNDTLGGYAEGKVQAVIPIIGNKLRLQPTALISYSAGDRSEAETITPAQIGIKSSSTPLYGFNHFQGGAELVLQVNKFLSVNGFGDYAYHIAAPVAGTEKSEGWGGAYFTVSY